MAFLLDGPVTPVPAARYPAGRTGYEEQFAATRRAVGAGHLLAEDVDEVLALGRCAWPDPVAEPHH